MILKGGESMALTEAQRRANDKYIKENYQKLSISYPKEYCEAVKAAAKEAGESLAGYVKKAIDTRMEAEVRADPDTLPELDPLADLD